MRKSFLVPLMIILLASFLAILTSLSLKVEAQEWWTPYVPSWEPIEFDYWKENGASFMNFSITWGSSGFNVSDWGTPTIVENNISVNALIWRYGGITLPVLITEHHTYNLGNLESGEYLFIFKAWGFPVKNTTFTVKNTTSTAAVIVPDDYPTIQEAINHANEGDTVFIRNGTYHENVVINKTISLVGEDKKSTVIDGNGTGNVVSIVSNNTLTQELTIQNGQYGIVLNSSHGNTIIANNVFSCSDYGVYLRYSSNNILRGNNVSINGWAGIWIGESSNNTISGNIAAYNYIGIRFIGSSHYNLIEVNSFSENDEGVHLNSHFNTVKNNYLTEGYTGISLWAWYNNITGNLLLNNNIRIEDSNYNNVYHNNFHNISISWHGIIHHNNKWDNGCEGNYWSSYNGSDSDGDGTGDTPYIIDENNQDNYPLMNLYWNPTDINRDLKVDIRDIATAALAYGSYPSHPKWNPHADITGSMPLEPDGKVDIRDIGLIAINYGKEYNS